MLDGIEIFADVADEAGIARFSEVNWVQGFTTNPSLLKKAGVSDYKSFAVKVAKMVGCKSISFEVVSDDEAGIERDAKNISSWGENVFVKIPFLKTDGSDNTEVIRRLAESRVKLNITAVFNLNQVDKIAACIGTSPSVIISVFAGRIADTGVDPKPIMIESKKVVKDLKNTKILWASARELFNAVEAKACGCDIITMTLDLLDKFKLWGTDLNEYSRKTAEQFYKDAKTAQLTI